MSETTTPAMLDFVRAVNRDALLATRESNLGAKDYPWWQMVHRSWDEWENGKGGFYYRRRWIRKVLAQKTK